MSKSTFAGTVISCNPNKNKDQEPEPGGSMLVDFKVLDGKPLTESFLAQLRINDQDAWNYMTDNKGLGKGAMVGTMANGVHEWDPDRDRTLKAKGDLESRPIHRFNGLDISTTQVLKGVKAKTLATTEDEAAVRSAGNLVSALANAAKGALTRLIPQATQEAGAPEEQLSEV